MFGHDSRAHFVVRSTSCSSEHRLPSIPAAIAGVILTPPRLMRGPLRLRKAGNRMFYAVLHMGPINSPVAAVQVAIVAQQKAPHRRK